MSKQAEKARHYLLHKHRSPLNDIMHQADLNAEKQYCTDIENAYLAGYQQAEKDYVELAQLWVESGDANVMSFSRFLKTHEVNNGHINDL